MRKHVPIIVAALLVTFASFALGEERVTVLLKDGERFEQATYRVLSGFSVLEVTSAGKITNVSFSDIDAILDAGGDNIAAKVLGKGYRPRTVEPVSGGSDSLTLGTARMPASRPPWRVALTMAGRLDVPTGDYYDGIKGGAGFGGTLHVRLSHDLALQGSVTELGLGFEDKFGIISYDPQLQIVSQNYDMDALRLLAGVEYHKAIRTSAARWGFWYLHASVGAIRHKLTGEAVLFDAGTSQTYRFVLDDTDTRFTMENGIGLIYGLSDRIGIAAQADVDGVWTDDYSSGGGSSVAIRGIVLGGNIGLAVRL